RPCDAQGNFLPLNTPPAHRPDDVDWTPFADRPTFEFAELVFEEARMSKGTVNHLLRILAAKYVVDNLPVDYHPLFRRYQDVLEAIDSVEYGEVSWRTYAFRYEGPVSPNSPSWKREVYFVHCRDALRVAENLASSPDFNGRFDYVPYEEFTGPNCRQVSNLMSGRWAYKQADTIAADPTIDSNGAMLISIVLGADKTTVSVATGNQEFHPLYMSLGNIHNNMRRAHRDSVVPLAFLAIPTTAHEWENDEEFRIFKKRLYHASIAHILAPLRPGMETPHVMRCPDGHFRRAIFEIGPFIADYPEQVYLSGVVQGWCPKCLALPKDDFLEGEPRSCQQRQAADAACTDEELWDVFGINPDVTPFTSHFPRADIHELLTPDLLHQVIKGTFKDHLVEWVLEYIKLTAPSEREANRIIDDIDRRISAVPCFPGLRRFPQGRNFKQWTGDDSKALMKVFLPAIAGHVPKKMVQCITVFLDFCYLARRPSHDTRSLDTMRGLLTNFHELRSIFVEAGVRMNGFGLPRQHSLVHYVRNIQLFGSPNGLCSSITESKHISAVKQPWRESNRRNPLGQILRKLTRRNKLAAARVEFGRRGMLYGDVLVHARLVAGVNADSDSSDSEDTEADEDERFRELAEAIASDESPADAYVTLSETPAYTKTATQVSELLNQPHLIPMMRRFLYTQARPDGDDADQVPLENCPYVWGGTRLSVFHSASAAFFAPSEHAGPNGMQREMIRATPCWWGEYSRYDTVFISTDQDTLGMDGMEVARVRGFLSFEHEDVEYKCAIVEWFDTEEDLDPVTGMYVVSPAWEDPDPGSDSDSDSDPDLRRLTSIVPLQSIVRACHLIGVYGTTRLPSDFHFSESLDAFRRYYVNWYADYHSHETIC
ncbi:hypothetical protein LXA43DRAFT_1155148, partial [Ganoderma leucocontextum]